MAVREYIGARYVPIFADPITWDETKNYEPLTIVLYNGDSYTSRQYVPAGTAITNDDFWAKTGNYNAQIEAYYQEVQQYSSAIAANTESIETINETTIPAINADIESVEGSIDDIEDSLASLSGAISDEEQARIAADNALSDRIDALDTETPLILFFGDSWLNPEVAANWWKPTADSLGCDFLNFGEGGTGWVYNGSGGNNFAAQVVQAAGEMTEAQKKRVKYIVVVGGMNDFTHNSFDIADTINNAYRVGIPNFKTACATYFNGVPVYGSLNVPFWRWTSGTHSNFSGEMFFLNEWCSTYEFRSGICNITPIKNFNWMLWTKGGDWAGYKSNSSTGSLHPDDGNALALATVATINGAGADACISTGWFNDAIFYNSADSSDYFATSIMWQFKNGELRIKFDSVDADAGSYDCEIPTTGWGPIGHIMHIKGVWQLLSGFQGDSIFEGYIAYYHNDPYKFHISKKTNQRMYVMGEINVDLNSCIADQDKYTF